ncbi:MAG TPA: hypothetical protein VHW23_05050 [Kofleriaceae bacterium]|nr:hypothetical protein [Kofleriaceae bacterium]
MFRHSDRSGHGAVRVLTAGIDNPALIARWRAEPELLRGHGVEPSQVDLDALWRFAGLTVKVRHNALREELPASFRLMSVAGLEIELFASYASERATQGARLAPTTEGRLLDLMVFLEGWLDRDSTAHALLWDLIRHERALGRLARAALAVGSSPDLRRGEPPTPPAPDVVPRIRGEIMLHEMTSDPQQVARVLHADAPDLAAIPRVQSRACYWRTEAGPEVSILQLDELAFGILGLVDSKRTAAEIFRALGGSRRPPPGFLGILGELQTIGIVTLRRPW